MYKKGRVNSNSRIISTDEDPNLQVVNNLFQTCHNKLGTSIANTTC